MAFQFVTLEIAEVPSCSYILISRLIARNRKHTVLPLSMSLLLNLSATPMLLSHYASSASI
jgi:hypothetical protein